MFRLLILNTLGLGSNTPVQQRNVDQDDLLIYTLKGSPRRFVRDYLQKKLGKGLISCIKIEELIIRHKKYLLIINILALSI